MSDASRVEREQAQDGGNDGVDRAARTLLLDETDNVAVSTGEIGAGETIVVAGLEIIVRDFIPVGHKVALVEIPTGGPIRKYGEIIGTATQPIAAGAHVHIQNVVSARLPGTGSVG